MSVKLRLSVILISLSCVAVSIPHLWRASLQEAKGDEPAGTEKKAQKESEKPWERGGFRLEVIYIKCEPPEKALFGPGYWVGESNTFYRWKGIVFPPEMTPIKGPYQRILTVDSQRFDYKAVEYY